MIEINILTLIIYSFVTLVTLFFGLLYFSAEFNRRWFSWYYTKVVTPMFAHKSEPLRAKLFEHFHKINFPKPPKILEIGPAMGYNFAYYPDNSRVISYDINKHFETYFNENRSKFAHIVCEEFKVGNAEDMSLIADHSVDVVVATFVLCSVKSREKVLREIKRVLKKGGTYFFVEHVGYPFTSVANTLIFGLQCVLNPLWYLLHDGCYLCRHSGDFIKNAGFSSLNLISAYPDAFPIFMRAMILGTATTDSDAY